MAELILKTNVKRESGYLYFLKSDDKGFLGVYKSKMARGGRKPNSKKKKK